jgi:hypothetical protein
MLAKAFKYYKPLQAIILAILTQAPEGPRRLPAPAGLM